MTVAPLSPLTLVPAQPLEPLADTVPFTSTPQTTIASPAVLQPANANNQSTASESMHMTIKLPITPLSSGKGSPNQLKSVVPKPKKP